MESKIFKDTSNKPINVHLNSLAEVQSKVDKIIKVRDNVIKEIREGLVESVVVFIDLVDSTKYKIETQEQPEKWITRVKQFGDVIREYIVNTNGKVVKYIGDEVMGVFDKPTKIDDALSLVLRIKDIEKNLSEITGTPTLVKIALDFGKVYLVKYDGHDELDPQGTPIDRCARIGKHCQASTILSSFDLVSKCAYTNHWFKLGNVEMKGLGNQPIYQYGEQTIELKNKIEVAEEDLLNLKKSIQLLTDENQSLSLEKKTLISSITELQQQLKAAGEKPVIDTSFEGRESEEQKEKDWDEIQACTNYIRKLIAEAGVPESEYGRFIFLHLHNKDEEYSNYKNKTFDSLIEKGFVIENDDDRYELNDENKRNIKILKEVNEAEELLGEYTDKYGPVNENDLFEHTLKDADFWKKYLFINVIW